MIDDELERLIPLLADAAGMDPRDLGPDSSPESTQAWDSVANLVLLAGAEDAFGVRIPTADAVKSRTLGELAALIHGLVEAAARGADESRP